MKNILKSNVLILYSDLEKAIQDYIDRGRYTHDIKYINAYLPATLGAIVAFTDRYMKESKRDGLILACRGANNTFKHEEELVEYIKSEGGFSFPISFPLTIKPIEIVWKYTEIHRKDKEQNIAYKKYFAGRNILETLEPIIKIINNFE